MVEDDPLIALDLKATLEHAGVVALGRQGALTMRCCSRKSRFQLPLCWMCAWRLEPACVSLNRVPNGTFRFCFTLAIRLSSVPHIRPAPVLRKPFRPEQLIAALDALLAKER
jgi:hypothetical protein